MSDQYRVLFRGDVVNGSNVEEVKLKLAKLLNENDTTIDKLFSGETYVIKKSHDLEKCEKIRRSFIAVGAVCHIKDPSPGNGGKGDDTLQIVEDLPSVKKDQSPAQKYRPSLSEIPLKVTSFAQQIGRVSSRLNRKARRLWKEGSESIQSDMEIGGTSLLIQNKYFLWLSVGVLMAFCLAIVGLTYERLSMPLTEENFDNLLSHIEFIENAFTSEELENMTRNRSDFLDYLLVDPIKKMGYQFEPSLMEMTDEYLDGDLSPKEMKKARAYLEIASNERDELLKHKIISAEMKNRLDKVAQIVGRSAGK